MSIRPMQARCHAVRLFGRGDCQGYLLLEILIAVAVFSIGFMALGTLLVSTARNNRAGNMITQATLLAVGTLEDLKKNDLAALAPGRYSDLNNPINENGNAGGIFTRSWTIEDPLGYGTSRRIRVQVSWERLGRRRTVELDTITRGNGT
jgi:type II secretory pathway pseudopilin PulG